MDISIPAFIAVSVLFIVLHGPAVIAHKVKAAGHATRCLAGRVVGKPCAKPAPKP